MTAMQNIAPLWALPGNRADSVSFLARSVSALFGCPSFLRANGMRETGVLADISNSVKGRKSESVPVFQVDRKGGLRTEKLPRIWLSEIVPDKGDGGSSRRFVCSYPNGHDSGGKRALELAERYFSEGLSCYGTESAVECFQAAEILYLHACERGSVEAHTRLGVLYRSDMCKGRYWKYAISSHAKHARECVAEKAVKMLRRAAARGSAEAKWQLGDMIHESADTPSDEALAFSLYKGSFCRASGCSLGSVESIVDVHDVLNLVQGEDSTLLHAGCAARRIAECVEAGRGCAKDARRALAWYEAAAHLLDSCVDAGCWHYAEELARAQAGAARALGAVGVMDACHA